jgi:hypothetical protein
MQVLPVELLLQVVDVHFLSERKTVFVESVVFTPGKMVHQLSKAAIIEMLGGPNPGSFLEAIAILLIGEAQLPFDDMNDGQLLVVQHNDPCLMTDPKLLLLPISASGSAYFSP